MSPQRWFQFFRIRTKSRLPLTPVENAHALIKAIDAEGLPLIPARVNHIARQLGLDVSTKAPVELTIARIRKALLR